MTINIKNKGLVEARDILIKVIIIKSPTMNEKIITEIIMIVHITIEMITFRISNIMKKNMIMVFKTKSFNMF